MTFAHSSLYVTKKTMPDFTLGPAPDSNQLRVLLVDDHDDLLLMLRLVLSRRSYNVVTATSGQEALQIAEDFSPHVIVSDLGMPGMTGLELMENLRQRSELGGFKAIALSGFDDQEDADSAIKAGFDAHIAKPVDFEQLFNTIDRLTH